MAEETNSSSRRPILILITILVAVIVASLVVVFLLPDSPSDTFVGDSSQAPPTGTAPLISDTFNLSVLQRSSYNALNTSLLESRLLPVQPPADAGKANPFL